MKPVSSRGRVRANRHHVIGLNVASIVKDLVCLSSHLNVARGSGHSYRGARLNPGGRVADLPRSTRVINGADQGRMEAVQERDDVLILCAGNL